MTKFVFEKKNHCGYSMKNGLESMANGTKAEQLVGSILHSRLRDDNKLDLDRIGKVGVKQK